MINAVIVGIGGRMGYQLAQSITNTNDICVFGGIEHPQHSLCGSTMQLNNIADDRIPVTSDLEQIVEQTDVVIDFSSPEVTIANAIVCSKHQKPFISGTTNLTQEHFGILKDLALETPMLWSANMSIGVNIMFNILDYCADIIGKHFDIGVLDIHHKMKRDAPSGTAKSLASYAKLNDMSKIQSLRLGNVFGDHTVFLCGLHERIEITHRSQSREAFADGTIMAIRFLQNKGSGFYTMQEVINEVIK